MLLMTGCSARALTHRLGRRALHAHLCHAAEARELPRFSRMPLAKARSTVRILSPRMVERMNTNHLTPQQRRVPFLGMAFWAEPGFGLGVSVIDDPHPGHRQRAGLEGHTWLGRRARHFVDPEEELVAIMMIQLTGGGQTVPMIPAFEDTIYQAIEE